MALIIKRQTKKKVDIEKELNDRINDIESNTNLVINSIEKINRTLITVLK